MKPRFTYEPLFQANIAFDTASDVGTMFDMAKPPFGERSGFGIEEWVNADFSSVQVADEKVQA